MRSDKMPMSRYVQGGKTESFPDRLGWWDRRIIPAAPDDLSIVLTTKYHRRPYLLASDVYGRSSLMWIVLQFNNIVDVNSEFVTGRVIKLPSVQRVMTQILSSGVV